MKKVRHISKRTMLTRYGVLKIESPIYLPSSRTEKLKYMGDDYEIGYTYKRTNKNGKVYIGYGDKREFGTIEKAPKGYRIKPKTFIPYSKK